MNEFSLDSLAPKWIARRLVGRGLWGVGRIIVLVAAAGGVIGLLFMVFASPAVHISGKVVSQDAKRPIGDVMVMVESIPPLHDEKGFHSFVRTDQNGNFVAEAMISADVVVSAWKPGYAIKRIFAGKALTLLHHDTVIELREMTATNWVPEHEDREGFGPGSAFSFKLGRIVDADSPAADLVLIRRSENPGGVYIEARANGGIAFEQIGTGVDFYNTPEGPLAGYSLGLPFNPDQPGVYYVRTRDGGHYAKVRLLTGFKQTATGSDHSYFWLQWAYQPDGTRDLEIRPSREFPFPVEKFGFRRESLGHQ